MVLDRRMAMLNARHSRETGELFNDFMTQHPLVEVEVADAEWTSEQERAWTAMTADTRARQRQERAELVAVIRAEHALDPGRLEAPRV